MPTHRLVQPPCRLKIYPAKAEVSRCEQEAYYLRDNNVFNDVKYIFNKASLLECFKTGYVDWDECLSWRNRATGKDVILGDFVSYPDAVPEQKTDRR